MVRFVSRSLHESRMTVSATPPPTAHQSFSHLPWTHRVNLECHTSPLLSEGAINGYAFFRPIVRRFFFVALPSRDIRSEICR